MTGISTSRRGFTLVELLIALTVGIIVLAASLSFAVATWRTVEANSIRDDVYRNSRFIAMSLERDFQNAGVAIASTPSWGTMAAWGDSIVILSIPYEPNEAPPYELDPPPGTDNPLPVGGTCGERCVDLEKAPDGTFDIKVGDFARLQVLDTRRVVLVEALTIGATSVQLTWSNHSQVLRYVVGLTGGMRLDRFSSFVQKVQPVVYYLEGEKLMRAERFNLATAAPEADVIAYGVLGWNVKLIFTDGDELDEANSADADLTNDFDDIVGVRIMATLAADRPHPNVGTGTTRLTRDYEWRFAPRNLMYERNRI